ncbi:peptidoglycan-binding protein, partial [Bacteroidales bacterium MSK.15.36]|nr:peptidoglycan-binding protein [Bacteroidales bacterium MSK.15.36]
MAKGALKVQVWKGDSYIPIENTKVTVVQSEDMNQSKIERSETTDSSGLTKELELNAPPMEYSQSPNPNLPYSLVDLKVEASGFIPMIIKGCQIYPERVAYQECRMQTTTSTRQAEEIINVEPNTIVGNYPPKIPENPEKALPSPSSGFVVLQEPVIPEYIVVHQGVPEDNTAPNYTVRYKDYIKNVACCEIFSTWSENTI